MYMLQIISRFRRKSIQKAHFHSPNAMWLNLFTARNVKNKSWHDATVIFDQTSRLDFIFVNLHELMHWKHQLNAVANTNKSVFFSSLNFMLLNHFNLKNPHIIKQITLAVSCVSNIELSVICMSVVWCTHSTVQVRNIKVHQVSFYLYLTKHHLCQDIYVIYLHVVCIHGEDF